MDYKIHKVNIIYGIIIIIREVMCAIGNLIIKFICSFIQLLKGSIKILFKIIIFLIQITCICMLVAIIPYFLKSYLKEIIKLVKFYLDKFIKNLYNKIV